MTTLTARTAVATHPRALLGRGHAQRLPSWPAQCRRLRRDRLLRARIPDGRRAARGDAPGRRGRRPSCSRRSRRAGSSAPPTAAVGFGSPPGGGRRADHGPGHGRRPRVRRLGADRPVAPPSDDSIVSLGGTRIAPDFFASASAGTMNPSSPKAVWLSLTSRSAAGVAGRAEHDRDALVDRLEVEERVVRQLDRDLRAEGALDVAQLEDVPGEHVVEHERRLGADRARPRSGTRAGRASPCSAAISGVDRQDDGLGRLEDRQDALVERRAGVDDDQVVALEQRRRGSASTWAGVTSSAASGVAGRREDVEPAVVADRVRPEELRLAQRRLVADDVGEGLLGLEVEVASRRRRTGGRGRPGRPGRAGRRRGDARC